MQLVRLWCEGHGVCMGGALLATRACYRSGKMHGHATHAQVWRSAGQGISRISRQVWQLTRLLAPHPSPHPSAQPPSPPYLKRPPSPTCIVHSSDCRPLLLLFLALCPLPQGGQAGGQHPVVHSACRQPEARRLCADLAFRRRPPWPLQEEERVSVVRRCVTPHHHLDPTD
eukprot:351280-Chlamydomonas_euryale.AAC.6